MTHLTSQTTTNKRQLPTNHTNHTPNTHLLTNPTAHRKGATTAHPVFCTPLGRARSERGRVTRVTDGRVSLHYDCTGLTGRKDMDGTVLRQSIGVWAFDRCLGLLPDLYCCS
ncbi:hypothetical protein E2C01_014172 [Portunus trituberculatus]|uniref:Uncharacterized protein n=1 Tax=Portunus trituberculatus TaxID=210409 RepID=A0A5B7DJ74_PORTR|nr:hypothetical protein [Portunus trituberculatus]